jgi:hypothetical protein
MVNARAQHSDTRTNVHERDSVGDGARQFSLSNSVGDNDDDNCDEKNDANDADDHGAANVLTKGDRSTSTSTSTISTVRVSNGSPHPKAARRLASQSTRMD